MNAYGRRFIRTRDYAIISMLIATGARLGEVLALKMKNYNPDAGTVVFEVTKGKTSRTVPFAPTLVPAVSAWLTLRQQIEADNTKGIERGKEAICEDTLFLTIQGEPVKGEPFSKQFKHYIEFAGLEHFDRHSIRHHTITQIVAINPRFAQLIAGHKDFNTTARYDHTSIERLAECQNSVDTLGSVLQHKRAIATRKKRLG